jgi:hypothetical protein
MLSGPGATTIIPACDMHGWITKTINTARTTTSERIPQVDICQSPLEGYHGANTPEARQHGSDRGRDAQAAHRPALRLIEENGSTCKNLTPGAPGIRRFFRKNPKRRLGLDLWRRMTAAHADVTLGRMYRQPQGIPTRPAVRRKGRVRLVVPTLLPAAGDQHFPGP